MNKAYKFRIYPNAEQRTMLAKTFGCVRFIYNRMLFDKIKYYKQTKQMLNNTPSQYKKELDWLNEVDSLALANAQMNLQTAYNNFFRSPITGFPKFKSKKTNRKSYTTNCVNKNIFIDDGYIKLAKVGFVKLIRWANSLQAPKPAMSAATKILKRKILVFENGIVLNAELITTGIKMPQ